MRHHDNIRKFGRERKVRTALLRGLAVSLIRDGSIRTTEAKAKELRPMVEKMITRAKDASLASQRLLVSRLGRKEAAKSLINTIAPKYRGDGETKERQGGYTRIIKLSPRAGDASPMAAIEFV